MACVSLAMLQGPPVQVAESSFQVLHSLLFMSAQARQRMHMFASEQLTSASGHRQAACESLEAHT